MITTGIFLWFFNWNPQQAQADAPTQPIEFPHRIHTATEENDGYAINCLYCHSYARRSPVAGIPTLAKCMGCHRYIATDKERIRQLTRYWEEGKPIPWKKVHDLPDFVYFTHERHIQRFVFQQGQPVQQVCGYCHGDIKTMTVAEKRRPLTMGWCLKCHEQFQNNPADAPQPATDWQINVTDRGLTAAMPVDAMHADTLRKAPSDCWDCHK
ncbi:MAG: cytochrome c family protein [Gammaproteobacteria bacterium]|nr:cytochrome c family protein [Gammaproteobacteria bacterium]